MGKIQVAKAKLSFKDIFPTCQDLYNNIFFSGLNYNDLYPKIQKACNDFSGKFSYKITPSLSFYSTCYKLGFYLYYIKNKSEDDRKPYCNFFIYELKREVKNKKPKFEKFDKVHEELINAYKGVGLMGLDVCKEYILLMEDHIYEMFRMFDELYKYFKNLKRNKNDTQRHVRSCVNKYEDIIKKDKKQFNNTIDEELDKFKRDFHEYLQGKITYKCENELLNCTLMIPPKKITKAEALSGDTASPVTWTSTGVLFFAVLLIIFIHTAYGLCLRRRRKKLKNMCNRKNKKHYELMNLFEEEQKNIIQNKYNILYNSVD
ncbi:variable surface protein [Plasmodium gonderi]|uniref:Variable surface protein n=1 Tax=Plasmodium gonderi TaxID=77519 RepID=A0A1Y1JS62_PLAGO|nr:variable surface protein [Plasmodium gonderi]GAW84288.1 variable surface protein [Plasmodium gonderi]